MNIMKILMMTLWFLSLSKVEASYFRELDYDEIRKEGGFNSPSLIFVTRIRAAGHPLTTKEKEILLASTTLNNLRILDLTKQGIDNDFIQELSENPTFSRINELNLSRNKLITYEAIDHILDSNILGSIRDLAQISGRFGCPISTISVNAINTGIINNELPQKIEESLKSEDDDFELYRAGFIIFYRHSVIQEPSAATARGIKFIEVKRHNYLFISGSDSDSDSDLDPYNKIQR